MKIITIFALALIGVSSLTSCKKQYACKCTTRTFNGNSTISTSNYISMSKSNAKNYKYNCEANSNYATGKTCEEVSKK